MPKYLFRLLPQLRVIAFLMALMLLAACGGSSELAVGDPAPDFSLPEARGGEVSLSEYTGVKPTLLYFHMAVG